MSNIKITRKSNVKELKRRLKNISKLKVSVGVQGTQARKSDSSKENLTNAQIALKNEFGSGNNPERSFIRASVRVNSVEYIMLMKKLYKNILTLKIRDPIPFLEKIGFKAQDDMKKYAVALKLPPNSEETKRRKDSENPLVDTNQMINSILYKVDVDD